MHAQTPEDSRGHMSGTPNNSLTVLGCVPMAGQRWACVVCNLVGMGKDLDASPVSSDTAS